MYFSLSEKCLCLLLVLFVCILYHGVVSIRKIWDFFTTSRSHIIESRNNFKKIFTNLRVPYLSNKSIKKHFTVMPKVSISLDRYRFVVSFLHMSVPNPIRNRATCIVQWDAGSNPSEANVCGSCPVRIKNIRLSRYVD